MTLTIDDLRYLAVSLPSDIAAYKYNGDFDGELDAIKRYLSRKGLPHALRMRLELEAMIARSVRNNYTMSSDDALKELQKTCPPLTAEDIERFVDAGWVDHIRRNGRVYFENSAVTNILRTHKGLLHELANHGEKLPPPESTALRHETIERQHKFGYDAVRFTVEAALRPADGCLRPGETCYIHLPFPAVTPEQSEIALLESSHPVTLSPESSPIRTAHIAAPLEKDEWAKIRYTYVNRADYMPPDDGAVSPEQPDFYTGETYPHIRFTPLIRALADELSAGTDNPLVKARRAYLLITEHVMYSYVRPYRDIDNLAEYPLLEGHGDCGIQALLFITLCRCMGIPARWQSGMAPSFTDIGSHDWALFYVAPFGWLHCDPSYGGGAFRRGDELMREHYFGNLDPFRMVSCTDFQRDFDPPRRFMRDDPYDNQSGEAEYADAPVESVRFTRKVVSAERV
ncbi:MAG: transglutaminase domain-containing protein [Clostridiales bacterium]|nr:transglutaminase domain-containing protein [Clostridiales bacterium]